MLNFIKKYHKTLLLILFIALVIAGIFLYRYIKDHSGEYKPDNSPVYYEIKKFEDNQYEVVYLDEVDVFKGYHKDFVRLMINNPTLAYDRLTSDCKKNIFNDNYDDFLKYVKKLDKTVLLTSSVSKYNKDGDRIIVVDNTDSSYVFYEKGVWNYSVYINGSIR